MVTIDPVAAAYYAFMLALTVAKAEAARRLARIQVRLLKKQAELARKYRNIFAEQRAFYRNNFRAKVESNVRFYATDPSFTPDYVAAFGTAFSFGRDLAFKSRLLTFGSTDPNTINLNSYYGRRIRMYQLAQPADVLIDRYVHAHIDLGIVDTLDHLYRYEEYKENIYSARRFDRLTAVAEYSNKQVFAAAADGATSFGFLSRAISAKANFYGARANDLFYGAGNLLQDASNLKTRVAAGAASVPETVTYSRRMENQVMDLTYNLPDGRRIFK